VKYEVAQLAGVPSYAGPNEFNVLSVYREPDGAAFDGQQYSTLALLAPHLNTAFALRRRLIGLESKVQDLETALNRINVALILLDDRGKPLMVNAAAQAICGKRDGLLLTRSGIGAMSILESAALQALIARTISSVAPRQSAQGGGCVLTKKNGRKLHLLATPIPPSLADSPGRAVAMLLISDSEKEQQLPGDILRQLFCLTPAECRLALLLQEGLTLPEAAQQLSVGRETVRTQVKSILQKTGSRRQGELVKLLAEISALCEQPNHNQCQTLLLAMTKR
jgi:DNA-binding CsgD family transcriptional regulator